MKRVFETERILFGRRIVARVTFLDQGIHVLLVGGERSHVGAVSYCEGREYYGFQAEYHKEGSVSEKWARELSRGFHQPVTVACGIHYDNLDKAGILEVVKCTDEMLTEILHKEM